LLVVRLGATRSAVAQLRHIGEPTQRVTPIGHDCIKQQTSLVSLLRK
jgi:hypothetical protein